MPVPHRCLQGLTIAASAQPNGTTDAAGRIEREPFVLLADAADGHIGRMRAIEDAGITVGVEHRAGSPVPVGAGDAVWLSA